MKKSDCYRTAIEAVVRSAGSRESGTDGVFEVLNVLFEDYHLAVFQEHPQNAPQGDRDHP